MIHNNEIMNPNVITSCLRHYYDITNDPNFSTKAIANLQRKLSLPKLKDPVLYQQPSLPKKIPQIQVIGLPNEPPLVYMNHIYDTVHTPPINHPLIIQSIDPNFHLSEENSSKMKDDIRKMIERNAKK